MKSYKEIAFIGVFVATLIGGQLALSAVAGVEIVTLLAVTFSYVFGVKDGAIGLTAFSLIRCFIFGFFPNVIILYLLYYNLLAVSFGLIGKAFNRTANLKSHIVITVTAVVFTALFTLMDDVISPMFYGLNLQGYKTYFIASLPTMVTGIICSLITVGTLGLPIVKVFNLLK